MDEPFQTILTSYEGKREEIIPILQEVQESYSFLSETAMQDIAKFTRVPASQVYGIATFYAQFRFTPKGKQHVMVCRGTACHVNGAPRVLEETETQLGILEGETSDDGEYSLETVACIGACSLAPTVMINNAVHAKITKKKVASLFKKAKT
ncbi:MAG: NADH-quinone oxidoreductase subunit NuoE [Chloroflexi bacterium]|nr:NADH-quinone oxidoreductase subunit NuoE [Chloroflexota bacterium]